MFSHIDQVVTAQNRMLEASMFEPSTLTCPCCGRKELEEWTGWTSPHPAAINVPYDEAYICSYECSKEWPEKYWETVKEWHEPDN